MNLAFRWEGGVQWISLEPRAIAPSQAYEGDAGWDLACLDNFVVPPQSYVDARTGIAAAVPPGYFMRLVGRSSTFRKKRLMVIEGIIDAGFRGELFSCVYNPTAKGIAVKRGERLVQAIVSPFHRADWERADELPESERGVAGFGSSGS